MFSLKSYIPYIFILIFVLYACLPLFQPGFYTMHDDEQIGRLYDLDQTLRLGHFPPRIVPNLGFGYGYPFFNFYPPFAYYVGEVFHLLGFSLITSTKLMLFTGFFLSAVFMYLLSREFFGKIGGTLSAIAYTLLSYKAVDVYVRGAYAEFFAFVPLPLLFLSVWKIGIKSRSWFLLWNSFSTAVLILSHNLIALMSVPFLGAWILFVFVKTKDKLRFLLEICTSFIVGFFLSAYFFIPSYLERGQTMVNILTTELASYSLHFVCAYQLWDSMWGYGGSIYSCFDGISFEVGKLHIVASLMVFVLSVYSLIGKKAVKYKNYSSIIIFFLFFLGSLFLMVKFSKFLWDVLPPFWYIQFPWRYLLFAGFFSSFLVGGVLLFAKKQSIRIILAILVALLLFYFSIGRFTPQRQFNVDDSFYTNFEKIRWETSGLAYEYVPRGIKTIKSDIGTTKVDIKLYEVAKSSYEVINGNMSVFEKTNKPHKKEFEIEVHEKGIFQINTYSFPGWEIYVNGNKVSYTDNNKLKLINIFLEKGMYTLSASYTDTPPRFYGNIISVLGIIGVIIIAIYIYAKKTS